LSVVGIGATFGLFTSAAGTWPQRAAGGVSCALGYLELGSNQGERCVTGSNPPVSLGKTVLLKPRTKTGGCTLGPNPDPRCSPGAYYSALSKAVICSSSFRTGAIRSVPDSEKHQVEVEYGLAPKRYGSTLEIDHIVSLELGGSNDIANLFPEEATFANGNPGFHVKDALENKLHDLVCSGAMSLRSAQQQIAANWQALYKKVFGVAPA
jgi:hypothetical protein